MRDRKPISVFRWNPEYCDGYVLQESLQAKRISRHARVGTVDELELPMLEESGPKVGMDFFL